MEQPKDYHDSNILKTWALLSQGHKLIVRSGIPVIVDQNNMVLFVLTNNEYQKVFDNKSVHYDQATQVAVMLNTTFVKQKITPAAPPPGLSLFEDWLDIREELFNGCPEEENNLGI